VHHWLEKYIIMEEIQFRSATEDHFALMLFGESIPAVLSAAGLGNSLPENNSMRILRPHGDTTVAFRDDLWPFPVVTLFAEGSTDRLGSLRSELLRGASALPREIVEACMIEEGVPCAGAEISAEYNPLECNFWRFVSFTKGCYIGQEVIARLDSYHKLQKRMTGFQFEQGITPGPAPGSIFADGEESGTMTRSALSVRGDRWIGIGFLKLGADPSKLSFGSRQAVGRSKVSAVTLPFTMS
jgi:folate-binding protein YgfZ